MTNPTRVEVCCDPACENHNVQQVIELTAAEVIAMEAEAVAQAEQRATAEAEAAALVALKVSAKAKLVAGTPLTEEEAATLII
jgi:hypothetical protein